MKKADKFDPAKWLVENKITFQSRLDEMEKFDATAYQEKSNFEPKQYGDKYNVQFEVTYADGITSGNVMFKTFDVYAESEDEAIKKGEARLKEWSYTAFEGDPEFEMESYEFYGIENESEMNRNSDSLNENSNSFKKEYKYLQITPEKFKTGDFFLRAPEEGGEFFNNKEKVEILSITLPKDGKGNTAIIKTKESGDIKLSVASLYNIARKK